MLADVMVAGLANAQQQLRSKANIIRQKFQFLRKKSVVGDGMV